MTPERIAELRAMEFKQWRKGWISAKEAHDPGDRGPYLTLVDMNSERDEMLDEIERLRALAGEGLNATHQMRYERRHGIPREQGWGCFGYCAWWHPDVDGNSLESAFAAHAAHVAKILDGTP